MGVKFRPDTRYLRNVPEVLDRTLELLTKWEIVCGAQKGNAPGEEETFPSATNTLGRSS